MIYFSADVDYVTVSDPELNVCFEGFVDTFFLDSSKKLALRLNLEEDRFFVLEIPNRKKSWILPIESGGDYNISISEDNTLSVTGLNIQGILQYQSALNYYPGQIDWQMFKNDSMGCGEIIEKVKQDEIEVFRKLLKEKKITLPFFKLIENDRNCFYAFVDAWLNLREVMSIIRKGDSETDESKTIEIMERLASLFNKYNPNNASMMNSPSWFDYAVFMYIQAYSRFSNDQVNKENIEELFSEKHIPFWFEQIKKLFSGKSLESALSTFLYKQGGEEGSIDSEASISVYKFFKEEFPNSSYLKYFQKYMENTIAFYEEKTMNPSIHIIEDDSVHTFSELIAQFKGKKIYVDVWALWCGPCRAEFKYKAALEKILEKEGITPVYIVLAEAEDEKRWRATVNINELKGYHFRANHQFQEKLKKIYNADPDIEKKEGGRGFSIPWYLLIDENGQIIERHGKRPSEIVSKGKW